MIDKSMVELQDNVRAYKKLVQEGQITWVTAVKNLCSEFGLSISYCKAIGILRVLREAGEGYTK